MEVTVDEFDTFLKVKEEIQRQYLITSQVDEISVKFRSQELDDYESIGDHGLEEGDMLQAYISPNLFTIRVSQYYPLTVVWLR